MLSNGWLVEKKLIADIGESDLEHLQRKKTWEVPMKRNALREADVIVGKQEREAVVRLADDKPFQRRVWTQVQKGAFPFCARQIPVFFRLISVFDLAFSFRAHGPRLPRPISSPIPREQSPHLLKPIVPPACQDLSANLEHCFCGFL
jgi:hypothetical protein